MTTLKHAALYAWASVLILGMILGAAIDAHDAKKRPPSPAGPAT